MATTLNDVLHSLRITVTYAMSAFGLASMVFFSGTGASAYQSTSDIYVPKPSDCRVEPVSDELFATALARAFTIEATPTALLGPDDVANLLDADQLPESRLPQGVAADMETVNAITTIEQEFAACYNTGEFRRAAALVSDDLLPLVVSFASFAERTVGTNTPVAVPLDSQIPSVVVRDVRRFTDGRAGAIVDWEDESNFRIYQEVDGVWLIQDEIFLYDE